MSRPACRWPCFQTLVEWSEQTFQVVEGVAALAVPAQIHPSLRFQVNELACLEVVGVAMAKRRSRFELEEQAWTV